eukprot:COSAG01_NODE_7247_length_3283_cov_404.497173_1_plen_109_part_00
MNLRSHSIDKLNREDRRTDDTRKTVNLFMIITPSCWASLPMAAPGRRALVVGGSTLGYYACSVSVILFNKWAISSRGFCAFVLPTFCQRLPAFCPHHYWWQVRGSVGM